MEQYVLPRLTATDIVRLSCTCSGMRTWLAGVGAGLWRDAANQCLPPQARVSDDCSNTEAQHAFQTYYAVRHNIASGVGSSVELSFRLLAVSRDQELFAALPANGQVTSLTVCSAVTGEILTEIDGADEVLRAEFCELGEYLAVLRSNEQGALQVTWHDLTTDTPQEACHTMTWAADEVAMFKGWEFAPDANFIHYEGVQGLAVLEVRTGDCVFRLGEDSRRRVLWHEGGMVFAVQIMPSQLQTLGVPELQPYVGLPVDDVLVKVNLSDEGQIRVLSSASQMRPLKWSPDGRYLLCCQRHGLGWYSSMLLLDVEEDRSPSLFRFYTQDGYVDTGFFTADSKKLAFTCRNKKGRNNCLILDVRAEEVLQVPLYRTAKAACLGWVPNSTWLVIASEHLGLIVNEVSLDYKGLRMIPVLAAGYCMPAPSPSLKLSLSPGGSVTWTPTGSGIFIRPKKSDVTIFVSFIPDWYGKWDEQHPGS